MLSILIPSTPERKHMLDVLLLELYIQVDYCRNVHPTLGSVEVLVDDSKRYLDGGLSIGKKRESLVSKAKHKYCCFLDSDDNISPDYVETLLRLCNEDKDVCTFNAFARLNNYWAVMQMSLGNPNEESKPGIVKRAPWHICPVRSTLAKRYKFDNTNYGEDWSWFEKVVGNCQTEAHSEAILYQYNHGPHSQSDEITKYELFAKQRATGN